MEIWKDVMSEMPHPYPELAKKMILTSSEDEYHNITYELIEKERKIETYCLAKQKSLLARRIFAAQDINFSLAIKTNIFSCLFIINHPLARGPMRE